MVDATILRVRLHDLTVLGRAAPPPPHAPKQTISWQQPSSPAMSTAGPLVARWSTVELAPVQAGVLQQAVVEAENAGSAAWRTRGARTASSSPTTGRRARKSDRLGRRAHAARAYRRAGRDPAAGTRAARAIPPGRYRLAVDLVEEHRFWSPSSATRRRSEVDVRLRDASGARASSARAASRSGAGPSVCAPARGGLRGRRRRGRPRARSLAAHGRGARAVRAGRRQAPALRTSARLPVAAAAARAERRGRRPPGLPPRGRRAVDVRRPAGGQISIAIWSSTRVKTNAPSPSDGARHDEIERVGPGGGADEQARGPPRPPATAR